VQRLLALTVGSSFAAVILGLGLWLRNRPGPTHAIELHVVDQHGHAIELFGWEIIDYTPGARMETWVRDASHPSGIATAQVPEHQVRLRIRAPGLHETETEVIGPSSFPENLDITVPDLEVVSGFVQHAGRPVAGASVMLVEKEPDACSGIASGLVSGCKGLLMTTTDEMGSFRIGSDFPGMPYFVRASMEGFAPGMAGPASTGDPPVVVDLCDGGTIEGRLRLADGHSPSGVEVELYRTDPAEWNLDAYGHFTATTASDGAFRFEHIEAGPWLVRLRVTKPSPFGPQPPSDQVPFVVEVTDTHVSVLDMDMSVGMARLEAHATLAGKPWAKSWARILLIGEKALLLDQSLPDSEGRFTLRARAPGSYRLVLWGDHEHSGEPSEVSEVVALTRDGVPWNRDTPWPR
jgi:hypothetical protein